jgi:hypothetical protein
MRGALAVDPASGDPTNDGFFRRIHYHTPNDVLEKSTSPTNIKCSWPSLTLVCRVLPSPRR